MNLTAVYGFLIAVGILIVAWLVFVRPSERRDHERRLEQVRKRIAEREERRREDRAVDSREGGER